MTYGGVSFEHGETTIDFDAEIPESDEGLAIAGTVHVALPAGTITSVEGRRRKD